MTLSPVAPTERLRGVDIARGIALLGILFVNARFFFGPLGFAVEPSSSIDGTERTAADTAAWFFIDTFCAFKFISLFSLLFGFGLAMQAGRAATHGESPWPAGLRRLGVLALVGLLHWTLVWYGDILMIYALLGVLALACTQWSRRTVGIIAVALAVIVAFIAAISGAFTGVGLMLRPDDVPEEIAASDLVERGFDAMMAAQFDPYHPAWIEAERAAFAEGPFLDALLFRCVLYAYGFLASLVSYGWHSLLMMVCGVYAFKAGLFTAEGSAFRRRIVLPALALGLFLTLCGTLPIVIFGGEGVGARVAHAAFLSLGAMVMPFGYAAAIIEWGPKLPSFIATALERTGRQFMGCVLGDHAKLAIGTRIMTGSSVGTGAMWAAGRAISGAVGPFAWVTDDGERRFLLRKFMEVARTVMARRAVTPGAAYVARLEALHGPD
jgi:uncharacterized protein